MWTGRFSSVWWTGSMVIQLDVFSAGSDDVASAVGGGPPYALRPVPTSSKATPLSRKKLSWSRDATPYTLVRGPPTTVPELTSVLKSVSQFVPVRRIKMTCSG